jgi:Fe-S cluster biogenesis protein NfuA
MSHHDPFGNNALDWCKGGGQQNCDGCKMRDFGLQMARQQALRRDIPIAEVERWKETITYWEKRHIVRK